MDGKRYRALVPDELREAFEAYARAVLASDLADDPAVEEFVAVRARESHRGALAKIAAAGPLSGYSILARARLGFHYVIKVRFSAAGGSEVTLQNRWCDEKSAGWRIVEVEDLGLRSPWKRPDQPAAVNHNA